MLSAGEILLLNQLLYCPKEEDEKTTIHAYQGNTIGVLLNRWSAEPLPDEADCGLCMKGKEWNHIVRLIAENPDYGQIICRCESISKGEIAQIQRIWTEVDSDDSGSCS